MTSYSDKFYLKYNIHLEPRVSMRAKCSNDNDNGCNPVSLKYWESNV